MTFQTALAVLVRARTDVTEVVEALCHLASLSHAIGEFDRRDDSIEAAAELLRAQPAAPMRLRRVF